MKHKHDQELNRSLAYGFNKYKVTPRTTPLSPYLCYRTFAPDGRHLRVLVETRRLTRRRALLMILLKNLKGAIYLICITIINLRLAQKLGVPKCT